MRARATIATVVAFVLSACPSRPTVRGPDARIVPLDGVSVRGLAGDATTTFVASSSGDRSAIEARGAMAWKVEVAGTAGPLALGRGGLAAALSGTGTVAGIEVRGGPAAVLVVHDPATGAVRWTLPIDATEWSLISAIAPLDDGFVVGGSFGGTLRASARVVSSAGRADGFVARITGKGEIAWLVRVGGANADAVGGVAAAGDRIVIAGTFSPGAELFGEAFPSVDDRSPRSDVFVAELTGAGARTWQHAFGGPLDDAVAGVAIDGKGRIAVATTGRDRLQINVAEVRVRGPSDGLLTYYAPDGTAGPTLQLGGPGFDGLGAVAASGDAIVVAGFFGGPMSIGAHALEPQGDDAFVAAFDGGNPTRVWHVGGPGREEIAALAPLPGGFVAAVAHTAGATIDGEPAIPAPGDPMTGVALVVRALK